MRKTIVTLLCSALIAASSIPLAAAADRQGEHHAARKTRLAPAAADQAFRNSNNAQLRDYSFDPGYNLNSGAAGPCGLFPGPCQ